MATKTGNEGTRPAQVPVVILIPAFNEGEIIADVISEIRQACPHPVIVIDDASTDNTIVQAQQAGATVIPLPAQLGAWGATQTGLRYARRQGYEVAVTMDADGQHEARFLDKLLQPVTQGTADVAIGSYTERGSMLRKIAWALMKRASGLSLDDITSGFRVYNHKAIRELASRRATFLDYQDIGVLLLLQSKGIRIANVAVTMQPRRDGKSRLFHSWHTVLYYMCHTLLLGLSKRPIRGQHSSSEAAN